MHVGGLLLIQPEHFLLFELMGLERLLAGDSKLSSALMETRHWLELNSRDILDESDKILSMQFKLIYSMDTQFSLEFSPNRWNVITNVLGLIRQFARSVLDEFPRGLELKLRSGESFLHVRILQFCTADILLRMVASEICKAGLSELSAWSFLPLERAVLLNFLISKS